MGNQVSELELEAGDVIYRPTKHFELANHYGVCVGNGRVIHFSREFGMHDSSFQEFSSTFQVSRKSYTNALPKNRTVELALYYYENPDEWEEYDLVFNNCEHFASFCATEKKSSGQVKKTTAAVLAIGAVTAVTVAVVGGVIYSASKDEKEEKEKRK